MPEQKTCVFIFAIYNTARTMTMWPDEEPTSFATEVMEAVGSLPTGVKFVIYTKGPVLSDFT